MAECNNLIPKLPSLLILQAHHIALTFMSANIFLQMRFLVLMPSLTPVGSLTRYTVNFCTCIMPFLLFLLRPVRIKRFWRSQLPPLPSIRVHGHELWYTIHTFATLHLILQLWRVPPHFLQFSLFMAHLRSLQHILHSFHFSSATPATHRSFSLRTFLLHILQLVRF